MVRGFRIRILLAVCAPSILLPSIAVADANLILDDRKIYGFLDLADYNGTNLWGPDHVYPDPNTSYFNPALDYAGASPAGNANGNAFINQKSWFDDDLPGKVKTGTSFSSISASGYAKSICDTNTSSISAQAWGESICSVIFSISRPHQYEITGYLETNGISGASVRARLRTSNRTDIFNITGNGTLNRTGRLEPGNYELFLKANAIGYTGPNQYKILESSFDKIEFNLVAVPEPSAILLIAALWCGIPRSRKPS